MRKSQMEILGLAIIVVLVILAIFLYVMFVPSDSTPQEIKRGLTDPKLASATLDSMLRTNIYCPVNMQKYSITEILQDCFYWGIIDCKAENDACVVAESDIELMLNSTLKKWGRNYQFSAKPPQSSRETEIVISNGECNKNSRQEKPANQPIPIASGILNAGLRICS